MRWSFLGRLVSSWHTHALGFQIVELSFISFFFLVSFSEFSASSFAAPEIFDNAGEGYGHAADWWSLGVIVYLMFTRKVKGEIGLLRLISENNKRILFFKFPVFSSAKVATEANNGHSPGVVNNGQTKSDTIVSNLPNHLDNIPAAAQDLMKRLFERNPRHRIRSVRELERIAMFHQFSFDECRARQMDPRKFIPL